MKKYIFQGTCTVAYEAQAETQEEALIMIKENPSQYLIDVHEEEALISIDELIAEEDI